MDRDLDGYIERCIQEIFGVTPEERNVILFDCGGRLAARLRTLGVPIVEDWIFWSKFRELFGNDDLRIMENRESRQRDYVAMKEAVVTDPIFECDLLEAIEWVATTFDCAREKAALLPLERSAIVGWPTAPSPAPSAASASRAAKKKKAPTDTPDVWRKRLIAAIGGYLSLTGERADIDRIKAVACRAARKDDFNRIGVQQLRSLYNTFVKQQKDMQRVAALTEQLQRDMDSGKH